MGLFVFLFFRIVRATPTSPENATLFLRVMNSLSLLAIPFFLGFFPLYAALRKVRVYEEFVEGAKEGFQVAVRIIPFLVAMLVAVGMFRGAGGVDLLTRALKPALDLAHLPAELLPIAFTRPLSGSATIGLFADLVKTLGPDHVITRMGGTILGSTETTLYVVAVYFGAVAVKRTRHAVAAGLLADAVGVIASVVICRIGLWRPVTQPRMSAPAKRFRTLASPLPLLVVRPGLALRFLLQRLEITLLAAVHETFCNRFETFPASADAGGLGLGDLVVSRRRGDDGQ